MECTTVVFFLLPIHHIITVRKCAYATAMESLNQESLGLRVRIERVKRRLKQSELAAMVGVSQADVSQLELDKKLIPARRKRILAALRMVEDSDAS